MPIEMYGDSWFVHFQMVVIIVLYYDGYTEPLTWANGVCMNHAEVI